MGVIAPIIPLPESMNAWYVLLVASNIAMVFLLGRETDPVGRFGSLITGIQVVLMIGSIFPTESVLKHTFDKKGQNKT